MSPSYSYSTPNYQLIKSLDLQSHPEGGFYAETNRLDEHVQSPFANGEQRSLATQIYYLLTPESPRGRLHMNKSVTFHLLHSGRAKYTLVRPSPVPGQAPEEKTVVMGEDTANGEVRQLVVEGGWWKASEIPMMDLEGLKDGQGEKVGCLISEVVVPGFHWEDHQFLSHPQLVTLFGGDKDHEGVKKYESYVRPVGN
ncbi:hypothetical protein T439DRAFT_330223 [Meredithblackwellia eburnea MCA 4105]